VLVADCGPAVTITPAVCPPSVLTLNVAMTNFSLPASGPFGQDLSKRELVSATQAGASWATNFSSNIANVWFRGAMQDTLNYTLTGQAHYYTYKAWIEFFF